MLNEKLEYDYYLSGDRKKIPLYNDTARDHFTGIRRPLQVLARGFLAECGREDLPPSTAIRACRGFLYTWMAGELSESLPEDLPPRLRDLCQLASENSFLQFANGVLKTDGTENVRNKAKSCMRSPYSRAALPKKSNFNEIRFDYIIADALYAGPLQEHCLALKDTAETKPQGIGGSEKDRKIALAVAGHYLQHRARIGNDPQREFIPLIQAEIGNWVNVRAQRGGSGSKQASVAGAIAAVTFAQTGEPLFEKQSLDSNAKIRVNPQWLTRLDVQLIPENKSEDYEKQGYQIIRDNDLLLKARSK